MQTFSVLSWNVQGAQHHWFGTSFARIAPHLARVQADIICLQELPDARQKLSAVPHIGDYFVFIPKKNAASDELTHGYNYNVLLSKFPFLHVEEFTFPRFLGPGAPLESGIRADIAVAGQRVRLYVCHLAIVGAGALTRMKQLRFLINEARKQRGPVIICGDMNAATPVNILAQLVIRLWHGWPRRDMGFASARIAEAALHHAEIMRHGFRELLDVGMPTWSPLRTAWFELFKLKLDWFFVKKIKAVSVELGEYVSDHRHVRVICRVDD